MSQNVAEGNAAFVIWSNECLDWNNWSEAFGEDYQPDRGGKIPPDGGTQRRLSGR